MSENITCTHDVYHSIIEILQESWSLKNSREIAENIEEEFSDKEFNDIIFDLRNVSFLDSSSIGYMIKLQKKLRVNDKDVIIVCENEDILMTFKVAQLYTFFKIYNSIDQAIQYVDEKALKKHS